MLTSPKGNTTPSLQMRKEDQTKPNGGTAYKLLDQSSPKLSRSSKQGEPEKLSRPGGA